jgi:hypothetical protein
VERSAKLKAAIFKAKPAGVWSAAYDYAVARIGLYRLEVQILGRVRSALVAKMTDSKKVLAPFYSEKAMINKAYQDGPRKPKDRENFMTQMKDVNKRITAAKTKVDTSGTLHQIKKVGVLLRAIPGAAAAKFPRPTPLANKTWAADSLVGGSPRWSPVDESDDAIFRHYANMVKKELTDPGRLAAAEKQRRMKENRAKAGAPGRERAAAARAAMVARRRETWGHGE